jgi:hypothetical protein
VSLDSSHWPTVSVHFPTEYTDQDFAAYLQELTPLLKRGAVALIVDTRGAPPPSALQRQELLPFVRRQWDSLHRLRGALIVVDSPVARHVLTAVSWMVAKPCSVVLLPSLADPQAWLAQRA